MVGTPAYMAPEQNGQTAEIGPVTDVYGQGATFYAMLTGGPPFAATTLVNLFNALLSERPAPPSRRNAEVPAGLDTICLRALEKKGADRTPTARAPPCAIGVSKQGIAVYLDDDTIQVFRID